MRNSQLARGAVGADCIKSVAFNGRFLGRMPTGVDRFAFETLRALDELLSEGDVVSPFHFRVIVPSGVKPKIHLKSIDIVLGGRTSGALWEQFELPWLAGDALLINLCNTGPILRRRQLTVIHDVAPFRVPESYGRVFRLWYRLLIPSLYKRSAGVATVSHFSKEELLSQFGRRKGGRGTAIHVMPEGTDHMDRIRADVDIISRHALDSRPYVLAVSSMAAHKNFKAVVDAMNLLPTTDIDLVVAGGCNPRVFSGESARLADNVKYVGYVSDAELRALYEHASCFVFPSVYEGYGLPPTEAMACGCRVLASSAASIPEVCGDGATYFDPRDTCSLASALMALIRDGSANETFREKGLARARALTWRATAVSLLDHLGQLL